MAIHPFRRSNLAGTQMMFGDGPPTAASDGTFNVGDVVMNFPNPTAGGTNNFKAGQPREWWCIVAGSPGTWMPGPAAPSFDSTSMATMGTGYTPVGAGHFPVGTMHFIITSAALTAAATGQNVTLVPTFPGLAKVLLVSLKHSASFTGGALSAMTVGVGHATSGSFYSGTALDVFQAPSDTAFLDAIAYKSPTWSAASAVVARFTSTGANVNAVTAGSVDIYVTMMKLSV